MPPPKPKRLKTGGSSLASRLAALGPPPRRPSATPHASQASQNRVSDSRSEDESSTHYDSSMDYAASALVSSDDEESEVEPLLPSRNATELTEQIYRRIEAAPEAEENILQSIEKDDDDEISEEELADIIEAQEDEDDEVEFLSASEMAAMEFESIARETLSATLPPTAFSPAAVSDAESMPPPRRPSEPEILPDTSEAIPHPRQVGNIEDFVFALGLWSIGERVSKRQYTGLLQILNMLTDVRDIKRLPKDMATLQKDATSQLPLLMQRRKQIPLVPEKLPTLAAADKFDGSNSPPMSWIYWFEPIQLLTSILNTPNLAEKMYFGMAHFVDRPTEFWHSASWGSSIRSTSGKYAHYPDKSPLFPSDFILYTCVVPGCTCKDTSETKGSPHAGRVWVVGEDHSSSAISKGAILICVQRLMAAKDARLTFPVSEGLQLPIIDDEVILVEDGINRISESNVIKRLSHIEIDITFETGIPEASNLPFSATRIRRVANLKTKTIRPICLMHPPRAELELQQWGRDHFVNIASNVVSIPMLCFIDGFGLWRNMYRSIMGVYLTLACMDIRQRTRRANQFPLTLGPHASSFADVISSIATLPALDKGVVVEVQGEKKVLCAYICAYTADMPQQQKNSGHKEQGADFGCRNCFADEKHRGDLDFDCIHKGRYHHHTMQLRKHGETLNKSKFQKFCTAYGLSEEQTPLAKVTPALDIIRTRPADPAHSEYAGMAKQAQLLFLEGFLTKPAQKKYAAAMRVFPFPPGWARLQSVVHHLKSWRMQEAARSLFITAMLLRCWLETSHVQDLALRALMTVFELDTREQAVDIIVKFFGKLAKSTSVVLSVSVPEEDWAKMDTIVKDARKMYQKMCEAAALAVECKYSKKSQKSTSKSPSISREPSPALSASGSVQSSIAGDAENDEAEIVPEFDIVEEIPATKSNRKKAVMYRKFKSRPNVHVGIHLSDLAKEYGTPNNVNVLQGEALHKLWKALAQKSNGRGVEKLCLHFANIQLAIRLVLGRGFASSEPDVTNRLGRIHHKCPAVIDRFLPVVEQSAWEDIESKMLIMGDETHLKPAVQKAVNRTRVQTLKLPALARDLSGSSMFANLLRRAYAKEYNKGSVVELGGRPPQWAEKFSFTDLKSEHRVTFNGGDYIEVPGHGMGIVRFDIAMVHELSPGDKRVFLVVTKVSQMGEKDPVLEIPILRLEKTWDIIGLSAVTAKKIYVVKQVKKQQKFQLQDMTCGQLERAAKSGDSNLGSDAMESEDIAGGDRLLYLPWELSFM